MNCNSWTVFFQDLPCFPFSSTWRCHHIAFWSILSLPTFTWDCCDWCGPCGWGGPLVPGQPPASVVGQGFPPHCPGFLGLLSASTPPVHDCMKVVFTETLPVFYFYLDIALLHAWPFSAALLPTALHDQSPSWLTDQLRWVQTFSLEKTKQGMLMMLKKRFPTISEAWVRVIFRQDRNLGKVVKEQVKEKIMGR